MMTVVFWLVAPTALWVGFGLIVSVWWMEWRQARRHPDVWELVEREKR